jgi:hypothetical protein
MRRSRLKPVTYSMCCQRPSRPPRHLRVAGHGTDAFIGERRHEASHGGRLEHRVTVDHDHDLSLAQAHSGVQRGGLAEVVLADEANVREPEAFDDRRRRIH